MKPFSIKRKYSARAGQRAFSLIEVVLAIGIMAFAIIPTVALLPLGLNVNRRAIEATVSSQILSRVTDEAQQTDFSTLPPMFTFCFDDQGNLLASGSDATLFSTYTSPRRLYDVQALVNTTSTLPSSTGIGSTATLAKITINVASNPGRSSTIFATGSNGVFSRPNVSTYFAFVSKND
jgi:uncharacterized protein (TIGR02598 family)